MYEKEMAIKNEVLKIRVGSYLYGTNTKSSDEDFVSIFVPETEYIFGLKTVEQVDLSVKAIGEDGKNTKDAVDCMSYELSKFARLALDNNPNILEILFVDDQNIVHNTAIGKELLSLRHYFLSKNIRYRFLGYAKSQQHKMYIKKENYEAIEKAVDILNNTNQRMVLDLIDQKTFIRDRSFIKVGDINIPISYTTHKALRTLEARKKKFSNRRDLISKYGYDTKFAMNLIRLLDEGVELLETGNLVFPLRQRDLLLAIKEGKYDYNTVLELAESIESNVEKLVLETSLPRSPNIKKVHAFIKDIYLKMVTGTIEFV